MESILTTTQTTTIPILRGERLQQTYVIGANGTGKSTHLLHNILSNVNNGDGVCVLDPHGDLLKDVISRMDYRLEDVVLLSITNPDLPFGLNLFHCPKPHDPLAVQNTVSMILNIFEKVYGVDRNTMARIINYLQALIYLFIHNPDLTVLDIPDILDPSKENEMLRLRLVQNLPPVPAYNYTRYFWTKYYNQRGYFGRDEELAGIFNKFREMTSVLMWPVFCQKNTLDFSEMMVQKKIVLCKLNADWPDITSLVGSILIGQILHAGYIRRQTDPFYVYCDEFQNFATYDFARLFAEARKFNIAMTIAHQTETQVDVNIREVCKQAGNLIVFRVTAKDSQELALNFDNTPPPGRIRYERMMEEVTLSEPMEWWEDEEAKWEYHQVVQEILQLDREVGQFFCGSDYLTGTDGYSLYKTPIPEWVSFSETEQEVIRAVAADLPRNYYSVEQFFPYYVDIDRNNAHEKWLYRVYLLKYIPPISSTQLPIYQTLQHFVQTRYRLMKRRDHLVGYRRQGRKRTLLGYKAVQITETEFRAGRGDTEVNRDLYRAIEEPSSITSREMSERIANKLAHLPNYTACIKTPSQEFTVTTMPPGMASSEFEFRRRVRFIQHNNLRLGYVRKREDVEQEFMEREPLVPDLSYQPNQPRHPSHANTMVVPPLPQSRKKKRNITV